MNSSQDNGLNGLAEQKMDVCNVPVRVTSRWTREQIEQVTSQRKRRSAIYKYNLNTN